jgi:ATP-dependent helicase IRC3
LINEIKAHHAAANSYTNILAHFGVEKHCDDSNILVWGCSATLQRHDGQALSQAFDKITFHREFGAMIKEGFLSDFQLVSIKTKVDLKPVKSSSGDFRVKDLSRFVNTQGRNHLIASSYKVMQTDPESLQWRSRTDSDAGARKDFKLRSTLVFACDIKHIEDLRIAFARQGVTGECIFLMPSFGGIF